MTAPVRRRVTSGRLPGAIALVALWCALWGSWSPVTVATGFVLAAAAGAIGWGVPAVRVRPVPLLRLAGVVLVDLVRSTWVVATEVLTPTDRTDEAIVRIDADVAAGVHRFVLAVAITLTPGTAVVGCEEGCLDVHLLHRERADDVVRHVHELVELVESAFLVDHHRLGGRS